MTARPRTSRTSRRCRRGCRRGGGIPAWTSETADCVARGTAESIGLEDLERVEPEVFADLGDTAFTLLFFVPDRSGTFLDVFPALTEDQALGAARAFLVDCGLPIVPLYHSADGTDAHIRCIEDSLDLDAYAGAQADVFLGRFEAASARFADLIEPTFDCPRSFEDA